MTQGRFLTAVVVAMLLAGAILLTYPLWTDRFAQDAQAGWLPEAAAAAAAPAVRPDGDQAPQPVDSVQRREQPDTTVAADAAGRGSGAIHGRVRLADGTPLVKTEVRAYVCRRSAWTSPHRLVGEAPAEPLVFHVASDRTDAEGRFTLRAVPAAVLLLLAIAPGTGRATVRFLEAPLRADESKDAGDVVLGIGSTFTGRLVDPDGKPVDGARVRVFDLLTNLSLDPTALWFSGEGAIALLSPDNSVPVAICELPPWSGTMQRELSFPEAVADESGSFRLEGLVAQRPALWVQQPGFLPLFHGPLGHTEGRERDLGNVMLRRSRYVDGHVLDAAGAPVAGAEVLVGEVGEDPMVLLRRAERCDDKGSFRIERGARKLLLAARRAAGRPWTTAGPLAGDGPFSVRLAEAGAIDVSVTAGGAAPAEGVTLEATSTARTRHSEGPLVPLPPSVRITRTGDGVFRIEELGAGDVRLVATAPGHVPAGRIVAGGARESSRVHLALVRGSEGRVKILEEGTEKPVRGAVVLAGREALGAEEDVFPEGILFPLGSTDPAGELVLDQLPPGTHRLIVRHRDLGCSAFSVTLPGALTTVHLRATGSLSGRVLERGGPPRFPVRVALMPDGDLPVHEDGWMVLVPVAADGTFRADGLTPGAYEVMTCPDPGHLSTLHFHLDLALSSFPAASEEVEIVSGKEATVTVELAPALPLDQPTGTVSGRVIRNGHPAPDLEVVLGEERTFTDQTGRFRFAKVIAGEGEGALDLAVLTNKKPPGQAEWQLLTRSLTLAEGEVLELELVVDTSAVRGRVTLARDGKPLAHRTISFLGAKETPAAMRWWSIETDETGAFDVPEIGAGAYWASDEDAEYVAFGSRPLTLRAGVGVEEVQLVMEPALTVAGHVVMDAGERPTAENWWVRLEDTSRGSGQASGIGEDGSFSVGGLAPGTFKATLFSEKGPRHAEVTLVVERSREDVRLEFKRAGR